VWNAIHHNIQTITNIDIFCSCNNNHNGERCDSNFVTITQQLVSVSPNENEDVSYYRTTTIIAFSFVGMFCMILVITLVCIRYKRLVSFAWNLRTLMFCMIVIFILISFQYFMFIILFRFNILCLLFCFVSTFSVYCFVSLHALVFVSFFAWFSNVLLHNFTIALFSSFHRWHYHANCGWKRLKIKNNRSLAWPIASRHKVITMMLAENFHHLFFLHKHS